MNLNKRSTYHNFKTYADLLTNESVIYINANNSDLAFKKLDKLFSFCNKMKILPNNVYIDITSSKQLLEKPNLIRLLRDKENVDVITASSRDIIPFCSEDFYEIKQYLRESNLGVFDLKYDNFIYERKPLLQWLNAV